MFIQSPKVRNLHINEFQQMMRRLYFQRDSDRGLERTYDRFVAEVEELRAELGSNDRPALENEFADVIAWLASIANIVEVNLERAAIMKYNEKCPKCGHSPCQCPSSG